MKNIMEYTELKAKLYTNCIIEKQTIIIYNLHEQLERTYNQRKIKSCYALVNGVLTQLHSNEETKAITGFDVVNASMDNIFFEDLILIEAYNPNTFSNIKFYVEKSAIHYTSTEKRLYFTITIATKMFNNQACISIVSLTQNN